MLAIIKILIQWHLAAIHWNNATTVRRLLPTDLINKSYMLNSLVLFAKHFRRATSVLRSTYWSSRIPLNVSLQRLKRPYTEWSDCKSANEHTQITWQERSNITRRMVCLSNADIFLQRWKEIVRACWQNKRKFPGELSTCFSHILHTWTSGESASRDARQNPSAEPS